MSGPLLIPDPEALRRPLWHAVTGAVHPSTVRSDVIVDAVLAAVVAHAVPAVPEHREQVDLTAPDTGRWTRQHRFVTDWQMP